MKVIVTRAQPDAARWVDDLRAQGVQAQALPLIAIQPVTDTGALRQAAAGLGRCAAVMFVSAHAAQGFFAAAPAAASIFGQAGGPRAWTTGPGTAAALRACGVAPSAIDMPAPDATQFDSEALWSLVQAQLAPGRRLLIVRGNDAGAPAAQLGDPPQEGDAGAGRDWLARQARACGAEVDFVVSYQRGLPVLDAQAIALANEAARGGALWLFNSSQAVTNLLALRPGQGWGQASALCTHERIAASARAAGFGVVQASRPGLVDVVASIESMP